MMMAGGNSPSPREYLRISSGKPPGVGDVKPQRSKAAQICGQFVNV
jgi:hypothetical protein